MFVSGFSLMPDGGTGGLRAESTVLLHSRLSEKVDFIPLDSSMRSLPPPFILVRAVFAIKRFAVFLFHLSRCDVVLIFASEGLSLLEKGAMCICARLARRGTVLRIASGKVPDQCERYPWIRFWLRQVLRSANVVGSQGGKWSEFYRSFPEARNKVVEMPNAIQVPHTVSRQVKGKQVFFAGWMVREKGIFDAIKVWELVLAKVPDAKLVMAGAGSDLELFQQTTKDRNLAGSIVTLGWVSNSEVRSRLNESQGFLFPSFYEGLPNAVLEALGAGVPVVSTRVGSLDSVIVDGVSGYLCEVGDVDVMAGHLVRLLTDNELNTRIGNAGHQAVRDRFDIDRVWRIYAKSFERSLMDARGLSVSIETSPEE